MSVAVRSVETSGAPLRDASAPILVLGLGNPIRGDDGVGWRVVREVARRVATADLTRSSAAVDIDCTASGALRVMERMVGYERAIVVDAVDAGRDCAGFVLCFSLRDSGPVPETGDRRDSDVSGGPPRSAGADAVAGHDGSLAGALRLGASLGASLPETIAVVAVVIADDDAFSERMSPAVDAAVPRAARAVMSLIRRFENGSPGRPPG